MRRCRGSKKSLQCKHMNAVSFQHILKGDEVSSLRFFRICFGLSLLTVVLMTLLPFWRLYPIIAARAMVVPMHYNIHFGVDRTGPWWGFFVLPAIGLGCLIVNSLLALKLWKRERMLSYLFAGVTVAVEIILFVAMVFVVSLNLAYG